METKFDHLRAKELYEQGLGMTLIAKELNVTKRSVNKALKKQGVQIRPINTLWDRSKDGELAEKYKSGFGFLRCAKSFGVSEEVVERALRRLDIVDSSRRCVKLHESIKSRVTKRRPYNFLDSTKKKMFQANDQCSLCGKKIAHWNLATYHHIVPVDKAISLNWTVEQTRSLDNCMILCQSDPDNPNPDSRGCHLTNFDSLHGNLKYNYGLAKRVRKQRVCPCGKKTDLVNSDFCFPCAARLFTEGRFEELNLKSYWQTKRYLIKQGFLEDDRSKCTECHKECNTLYKGKCKLCVIQDIKGLDLGPSEISRSFGMCLSQAFYLICQSKLVGDTRLELAR